MEEEQDRYKEIIEKDRKNFLKIINLMWLLYVIAEEERFLCHSKKRTKNVTLN